MNNPYTSYIGVAVITIAAALLLFGDKQDQTVISAVAMITAGLGLIKAKDAE